VKRRKAGSRVTTAGAFAGGGQALNADEDEKGTGSGFRKKAGSKRAREERAKAAEKRLSALRGEASMPTQDPDDTGIDAEELRETDKDRREAMMTSMDASEANLLRTGTLSDFWGDFILPKRSTPEGYGTGDKRTGDHLSPRGKPQRAGHTSIATFMISAPAKSGDDCDPDSDSWKSRPGKTTQEGLWHGERGSVPHRFTKLLNTTDSTLSNSQQSLNVSRAGENEEITKWSCLVCTLDNDNDHLACSVCATPRGDTQWRRSVQEHI